MHTFSCSTLAAAAAADVAAILHIFWKKKKKSMLPACSYFLQKQSLSCSSCSHSLALHKRQAQPIPYRSSPSDMVPSCFMLFLLSFCYLFVVYFVTMLQKKVHADWPTLISVAFVVVVVHFFRQNISSYTLLLQDTNPRMYLCVGQNLQCFKIFIFSFVRSFVTDFVPFWA